MTDKQRETLENGLLSSVQLNLHCREALRNAGLWTRELNDEWLRRTEQHIRPAIKEVSNNG